LAILVDIMTDLGPTASSSLLHHQPLWPTGRALKCGCGDGMTTEQILEQYPRLEADDFRACMASRAQLP